MPWRLRLYQIKFKITENGLEQAYQSAGLNNAREQPTVDFRYEPLLQTAQKPTTVEKKRWYQE